MTGARATRGVDRWIEAYVGAWNSNRTADIAALFTPRATYAPSPFEKPWVGRKRIVSEWLRRQDAPGSTTFRYAILLTTADAAIVRGTTRYRAPRREFGNLWVIRFDAAGRCSSFAEWWMPRPAAPARPARAAR